MNNENVVLKIVKGVVGLGCAVVAAELVAIGANAAFDDASVVKDAIVAKANPAPVKKGWFKK